MNSDEHFYQQALRELVEKHVAEGVFAQAFAETDGDRDRTRARYIKMRVKQLAAEFVATEKRIRQEAEESAARAIIAATEEKRRREAEVITARAIGRLSQRLGDTIRFVDSARHLVSSAPIDFVVEHLPLYLASGGYFDCETQQFESFQLFTTKLNEELRRKG